MASAELIADVLALGCVGRLNDQWLFGKTDTRSTDAAHQKLHI